MNQQLPLDFVTTMRNLYGSRGEIWCNLLPAHLATLARQWELDLGAPYPLSYNYVCSAIQRRTGRSVVLKTSPDNPEFHTEVAMLRHYNGIGAVTVRAVDTVATAMLVSAAQPGIRLVDSGMPDAEQTHVAAQLMRQTIKPVARHAPFPTIHTQAGVLTDLHRRHPEAVRQIGTVHHAAATRFFAQIPPGTMALHGDLHHENILSHDISWCIIDPKGVVGPPAAECAAFLRNPGALLASGIDVVALTTERIQIFAAVLALPPQEIACWNYALMILSAWWCYEETQHIPQNVRVMVEAFARVAALLSSEPS